MALLTRDQILNFNDLKTELVPTPEWDGSVMVRGLTAQERDQFEQSLYTTRKVGNGFETIPNKKDNVRAKLVSMVCIDEKGELLFDAACIDILCKKSAAPIDRIFTVAQKLSGFSKTDIEEIEKNS